MMTLPQLVEDIRVKVLALSTTIATEINRFRDRILEDTTALTAYSGFRTRVMLQDGRVYLYVSGSNAAIDNGITLGATGKGSGRWIGQVENNFINAKKWYNLDNTGVTDTTTFLQAAANACFALGKTLYLEDGNYKITSGLTIKCSFISSYYAIIKPTGSGYWAVTTNTDIAFNGFSIHIDGGGNTLNGIKLDRAVISKFDFIRVENCVGQGMEITRSYDNIFTTISIENCGTATQYAFSITNGGDTSNMSVIERLQVEQAKQLAISVSPDTLNYTINNIHSERAYVTGSIKDTWFFGGASSTYNNFRLNATNDGTSNDALARVYMYGASTNFNDGRIEGNIPVTGESAGNGSFLYINNCLIPNFARSANNKIFITGGYIANLTGNTNDLVLERVQVNTANPGFTANENFPITFINCTITTLNSSSTNTIIVLIDCVVNGGALSQGKTICYNTKVNSNVDVNYRALELHNNSVLTGNVTTNTGYLGLFSGSKIVGNLTFSINRQYIGDATASVSGTVTNFGPPEASAYAGGFVKGLRTWNPSPNVGQVQYYTCTVAGTSGASGTWVASSNL